jgi:hypothetical protein
MSEHDTQNAIIELLKLRGAVVTRINSGSMIAKSADNRCYRIQLADKGTSDIIALYKGVYLAIEVKYGKGKPTPEQITFLESVAEAGGVGLVAYDSEFVEVILNVLDKEPFSPLTLKEFFAWVKREPNRLFVRAS